MIYGQIKGLDKNISGVIMGCSKLRSDIHGIEGSMKLYDTAYENGINTFDTAAVYGDSECVIGKWIESKSKTDPALREKTVVITKGAHHSKYRKRVTPYDILSDIHESFAKTKLSYFDIYLLHKDDPEFPVGPVMDTLNRLRDEGKIKIFGVSNWMHNRIEEANNYALKHHLEPIRVSSPNFTLGKPNKEFFKDSATLSGDGEALDWYKKTQLPVFSYSALAKGFFGGIIKSEDKADAENILGKVIYDAGKSLYEIMANEHNFEVLAELEKQAEAARSTVAQAALKKLAESPFPVYPIFFSSKPERIIAAANAFNQPPRFSPRVSP